MKRDFGSVLLACVLVACGGGGTSPSGSDEGGANVPRDGGFEGGAVPDSGTGADHSADAPPGDSANPVDSGDAGRNEPGATCPTSPAPTPTPNATSDQLIDAAEKAGRITHEQSLIFKVMSVFGDPRQCAEFKAPASPDIGTPLMFEIARQFPSLSPATRAVLAPFFLPPIYEASAYAAIARGPRPQRSASRLDQGSSSQRLFADPPIANCGAGTHSDTKARKVTAHANIYYTKPEFDPFGLHEFTAGVIAGQFEDIYAKETALFNRFPMSDGMLPPECNGGDGALDIYTYYFSDPGPLAPPPTRGVTVPYLASCTTPSFMLIQVESTQSPSEQHIGPALAHEFFHVLQNGGVNGAGAPYTFAADCSDYDWLGEATGNWAIDYVFGRTNQAEQIYALDYMGRERKTSLDKSLVDGAAAKMVNGYTDYVFLQYLAKKYDPTKIKAIWDATAGADSVGALKAAGDLQKIWHDFARALWNDRTAGVEDEFYQWDGLEAGVKLAFDKEDGSSPPGLAEKSTKVDLMGGPDAQFDLMKTMRARGSERLSVHYDYLKFTDDTVSYLRFENLFSGGAYKIQALQKIGGTWRAPEDWSTASLKELCRDKMDERLEELVLVYSNGNPERGAPAIPIPKPATLLVSNVGCWRWSGTSSVKGTTPIYNDESTANLVFEKQRLGVSASSQVGFAPTSGTATYQAVPAPNAPCKYSTSLVSAAIAPTDGLLLFPLPNASTPSPGRLVDGNFQQQGTYIPAIQHVECGGPAQDTPYMALSAWLRFPMAGAQLSADGKTLSGSTTEAFGDATLTSQWNLQAVRE